MQSDLLPSPRTSSALVHSSSAKLSKQLFALFSLLPSLIKAIPVNGIIHEVTDDDSQTSIQHYVQPTGAQYYAYLFTSIILVLLGGIFAGLTLGLMGQDEVYLKVISDSGTPSEKKHAKRVLKLLGKGKHWVLVTLLLGNVITNETLPVILDRFLGGGFAAVFSATVAIVIFGEIIPQSICVRYGLQLGAWFAPYVQILMYVMYPVAYPIAKLLDKMLGEDHGTLYKKNGLKTLVTLHKTMGVERLNEDEVTIISAVLDLKAKAVKDIMTPIGKVFTMSSDTILDEQAVEEIFNAGFSRIPIHLPGEPFNFVGMLLVRILISYDPEDALPISSFPLATLPETSLDTSCLNILNYFQEGKSHMVIISESPGLDSGAKGVLTLEDVIEELIGEEIIDESDVYIDVDKNIKRSIPGPLSKRNVTSYLHSLYTSASSVPPIIKSNSLNSVSSAPQHPMYFSKRDSLGSTSELKRVTSGFKPSNLASSPLETKNVHVTIKRPQLNNVNSHDMYSDSVDSDQVPGEGSRPDTPLSGTASPPVEYGSLLPTEAEAFVHGVIDNIERRGIDSNSEAGEDDKLTILAHSARSHRESSSVSASGNSKNKERKASYKYTSVDLSDVRAPASNNIGSSIPIPKSARTNRSEEGGPVPMSSYSMHSGGNGSSGLIENIVSVRGVHKTVIEESSSTSGLDVMISGESIGFSGDIGRKNSSRSSEIFLSSTGDIVGSDNEGDGLIPKIGNRLRRDSKRLWDWRNSP